MTKKDFEIIAIALRRSRPTRIADAHGSEYWDTAYEQWLMTRRHLINILSLAYQRFDAVKFRLATEL